ncbi:MalY/PatB family protein [Auraticoccus monumenti]|uniref:cysteine-S-conjugate beta-lyase n=1 Tax=Auraticoccus monumenti TaxID=675864 RepID=A0A1G7BYE7_9ACTN|nr:aminotransferase class I/II-fold pyridoxal phosphate-dependent enzyme [Auraticoccus monumenti]SDE32059.1 cystathione beta-lyase [Auraticoccus monumenti]
MEPILSLSLDTLRRRTSMKWRRHPEDVLPLWVAEMDTPVSPGVRRELERLLADGDTGYPAGNGYAEAYADFAAEEWGWRPDPATVVLSPDVMQGVAMTMAQVVRPGDRVVINSPVYAPFWATVRNSAAELLDVPLGEDGRLDLDALERAYAEPDVTVHLMSSPHNPTGVVHTREELTRVVELARDHGVVLLVDEIHSPLVGPGTDFVPVLDVPGADDVVTITSASKAWNLAGFKAALLVPGPGARERLQRLTYESTRGAASHVALRVHTAALTEDRDWLGRLRTELQANRELLDVLLGEHLPEVVHRQSRGTYLAWLDCRALGLNRPASTFLERGRVALNDGADFGPATAQWVRINLATSPAILTEAVERMAAATRG